MLGLGQDCDAICQKLIEETIEAIDERRDCSDFVMVPLLWLLGAYGDKLPETLFARAKASVLGYRYWVDEPGNDAMWFWSENHVLCFHVSQYLAGGIFADEYFTCSGRKGTEQRSLAGERLAKWFASVESHGFAEWNSAAYYPIDFIGLLALEHWGEGAVATRACKLLDGLFKMIALHTLAGVPAGSMGRAYDKELRAGPCTELAPFATVAFGQGWLNDGVAALPMFCLGSYEPPAELASWASPVKGTSLQAHYVQGFGNAAQLALYKTASVQLSASIDGAPGQKGHQQHMLDIRFAGHAFARAWVNHPGEDDPWGHQRPSYWAGNGSMPRVGQADNVAMMLFDIPPEHRIGFTHVYAPLDAFDGWSLFHRDGMDWLILISGNAYAALTPCCSLEQIDHGPGQMREFRAKGRKAAWVSIVGDLAAGSNVETIREMLSAVSVRFDKENMELELTRPEQDALLLDYGKGLFVAGKAHPFPNPTLEPNLMTGEVIPL